MPDVGEVVYKAVVDNSGVDEEIKKTEKKVGGLSGVFGKIGNGFKTVGAVGVSALKGMGSAFLGLTSAASAGIAAVAKMGVEYNAQMQTYQTAFTTMLGDAEKAQQLTDNLKSLAAHTPLAMSDLADASQTLLAFGSSAEQIPDQLKRLGDVAQGDAQKLGTMATAFGRIQSNGRASLEEINMMIDQGFNPLSIIAEKTGESMEEVRDRVSAGKVSFEEISEALQTATNEGGQFYNAMENQSKTFEGQISTMKDNVSALTGTLTKDLFAGLTQEALPMVNGWIDTLLAAAEEGGVQGAIDASGTILSEALTALLNGAPKLIETAESLVGSFLDAVADMGPEITDGAIEVVLTLANGLVNTVPKLLDAAGTLIAGLIDGISNHLPEIVATAARLVASLASGLINNIPKILAAIGRLMLSLIDAILSTDWIQLGRNLVDSIIDGIARAWDALVSWFNGLWNSLFGGRNVNVGVSGGVNGSHAAGLEYVPFDGYIAELHKGEMVVPARAAEDYRAGRFGDFNRSIAEEFALDVNYNIPHMSNMGGDITAGIGGNFTGQTRIEVPLYLEGREIARASAWYVGEQLAWEER